MFPAVSSISKICSRLPSSGMTQITNIINTVVPGFFHKAVPQEAPKATPKPRPQWKRRWPTTPTENWAPTRQLRGIKKRSLRELYDMDKESCSSKVESVPEMKSKCYVVDFRQILRRRIVPEPKRARRGGMQDSVEQLKKLSEKNNKKKCIGASGVEITKKTNAPIPLPKYMTELLSSLALPPNCKEKMDFSQGLKLVADNEDQKIQLDAAYDFLHDILGG